MAADEAPVAGRDPPTRGDGKVEEPRRVMPSPSSENFRTVFCFGLDGGSGTAAGQWLEAVGGMEKAAVAELTLSC